MTKHPKEKLDRCDYVDKAVAWDYACEVPPKTRARLATLEIEKNKLLDALAVIISDVDVLIDESQGVYGLHLNGDPAPWDELCEGGRFEQWLGGLEFARSVMLSFK